MPTFDIDSRFGNAWATPGGGMAQAFSAPEGFDSSQYFDLGGSMSLDAMGFNTSTEFWNGPAQTYTPITVSEIDDRIPGMKTTDAIGQMLGAWAFKMFPELSQGRQLSSGGYGLGDPKGTGAWGNNWDNVNRWNDEILSAAQKAWAEAGKYGHNTGGGAMPIELAITLKAMVMLESGGNPDAVATGYSDRNQSPLWAGGLAQITNQAWHSKDIDYSRLSDPSYNLYWGAMELIARYVNLDSSYTGIDRWKRAEYVTFSGGFDDDPKTRHPEYWDNINKTWDSLLNAGGGAAAGGALSVTWGGIDAPVSQDFGMTEFARANPELYQYSWEYSRTGQSVGHPGLDVSLNPGTSMNSPVSGTVEIAGGSGFYCDDGTGGRGCGPGVGELRIKLDNGDIIILGHMRNIAVKVGQRVQAGTFVGTSGDSNGGHVHIEYRKWVGTTITHSGYEVIDPRIAFGGGAAGDATTQTADYGPQGRWMDRLRAAMSGEALPDLSKGIAGGYSAWGDRISSAFGNEGY